jgi:hypothetical protein
LFCTHYFGVGVVAELGFNKIIKDKGKLRVIWGRKATCHKLEDELPNFNNGTKPVLFIATGFFYSI